MTKIKKIYYSIGEVAQMLQVNDSLLRFWEKEFDCISPQKSKGGTRTYTENDIKNLRLVYHLVKEKGMTLEGAKKRLKNNMSESSRTYEVINHLKNIREELLNIKQELEFLEIKDTTEKIQNHTQGNA